MKNHISVTYLLLASFVLYATSPLSCTMGPDIVVPQGQEERDIRRFQLFFVDAFLNKLFSKNESSSNAPQIFFLIKKKHATLKNIYSKIKLKLLKHSMAEHESVVLSLSGNYSFTAYIPPEPCTSYKGFLIFSGSSPPFPG